VVLFHAGLGFPGGYVGVDVFFVISGFLITSLIWQDLSAGRFKIVDFWERRVRRILPALSLVVGVCLVAGWWILTPLDFAELGRSAVYQSLLVSNFYFWKGAGYFSSESTQPLLHTWSLAVEEQFYLLFPFLLSAFKRARPRLLVSTLVAGCALSLALSVMGTHLRPIAAFYLLPSRAWELLLGALLVFIPSAARLPRALNECLSWGGFAAIGCAALCYGAQTPFPGIAAVVPCLGAALVIWSNAPAQTSFGRLLSLRPCVFIGSISYSLYLWHWPLLVYARYGVPDPVAQARGSAVVVISVVLATFTWLMVETPFRIRHFLPKRRPLFFSSVCAVALLLIAGRSVQRAGGFRSRWQAAALRYIDGRDDKDFRVELGLDDIRNGRLTELGYRGHDRDVDLLLWGDSHAMSVGHALDNVCAGEGLRCLSATHSATAPLLDFPVDTPFSLRDQALAYSQAIVDFVERKQIKKVILVAAWSQYECQPPSRFEDSLRKTINALHHAGARIWIMEDVPTQPFDVPKRLASASERALDIDSLGLAISVHRTQNAYVNSVFAKLAGPSVLVVDPMPALSNRNGLSVIARDGRTLYFDRHHLSTYGATQLQPLLVAALRSKAQREASTLQ
jgi:peptidoglycan/LPS O-acetylase OafA/YrhL